MNEDNPKPSASFKLHHLLTTDPRVVQATQCPSLRPFHLAPRQTAYVQGDLCSDVFWIDEGIVKLSHGTEHGDVFTTALLGAGQCFGVVNLAEPSAALEETAQAVRTVHGYRMVCSDLHRVLGSYPRFAASFVASLAQQKVRAERKLYRSLSQTVEIRVLETLVELAHTFRVRCTHGFALEIRLTQQDVADLVGASRPVVSAALNQLRRRGVLDYTRDRICLNDNLHDTYGLTERSASS